MNLVAAHEFFAATERSVVDAIPKSGNLKILTSENCAPFTTIVLTHLFIRMFEQPGIRKAAGSRLAPKDVKIVVTVANEIVV